MRPRYAWNRRQVLYGMGCTTAAGALTMFSPQRFAMGDVPSKSQYAYVGSLENTGSIHVFYVNNDRRWTLVQTIPSLRPTFLAFHPNGQVLYAVNEIDMYRGLPRGAVEAFTIDARNGRLTKLNQQPLSLSGTVPQGLTISPDGLHAVVAVYGGGAYNVLPIAGDGSLGDVCAILKETGSGSHPEYQRTAHPHTVLFDGNGRYLLGTDLGSDRLNVFALIHGRLTPVARNVMPQGSGPAEMAIHPLGHLLFIANQLEATVASFSYNDDGTVGGPLHVTRLLDEREAGASCSLLMHSSGRFLYTSIHAQSAKQDFSNGIGVWRVHPTGSLSLIQFSKNTLMSPRVAAVSSAGDSLYLMDGENGAIFSIPVDAQSGCIGTTVQVAKVPMLRSLVMNRS